MSYGELTLGPIYTGRDRTTGRFLKGMIPANKGKKWNEFMPKCSQRRCAKGWRNLELHRCKGGGPNGGTPKKRVVAIADSGKWVVFPSISAAVEWIGGIRSGVSRCCQQNQSKRKCKRDWRPGQPKGSSRVNTDHRYMGIRFYYENDDIWIQKVQLQHILCSTNNQ